MIYSVYIRACEIESLFRRLNPYSFKTIIYPNSKYKQESKRESYPLRIKLYWVKI